MAPGAAFAPFQDRNRRRSADQEEEVIGDPAPSQRGDATGDDLSFASLAARGRQALAGRRRGEIAHATTLPEGLDVEAGRRERTYTSSMEDEPPAAGVHPGVEPHGEVISSHRLESFSDGVMAVIITIMAFELKPPDGEDWSAFSHRLPALLVYVLSFTVVGIYWNNHHHLLRATRNISGAVMWSNLSLLFCLSLVPVTTNWIGDAYHRTAPAVAYGVVAVAAAAAYFILVRTILRANHHDEGLIRAVGSDVKGLVSPAVFGLGIGLAFVSPYLSYGCYAAVSIMWIVPDRRFTRSRAGDRRAEPDRPATWRDAPRRAPMGEVAAGDTGANDWQD